MWVASDGLHLIDSTKSAARHSSVVNRVEDPAALQNYHALHIREERHAKPITCIALQQMLYSTLTTTYMPHGFIHAICVPDFGIYIYMYLSQFKCTQLHDTLPHHAA